MSLQARLERLEAFLSRKDKPTELELEYQKACYRSQKRVREKLIYRIAKLNGEESIEPIVDQDAAEIDEAIIEAYENKPPPNEDTVQRLTDKINKIAQRMAEHKDKEC